MVLVLLAVAALFQWLSISDAKPETQPYLGSNGPRIGTMKPADTCIGWAHRGRQASHAL